MEVTLTTNYIDLQLLLFVFFPYALYMLLHNDDICQFSAEAAVTPQETVVMSSIPLIVIPKSNKSSSASNRRAKFIDIKKIKGKLGELFFF